MRRIIIKRLTYRNKLIFITVSAVICVISLIVSDRLARELQKKENNEIKLWSLAMSKMSDAPYRNYKGELEEVIKAILDSNNSIPSIITDENMQVIRSINIPNKIAGDPVAMHKLIYNMANDNGYTVISVNAGSSFRTFYVFYGNSFLISILRYFPFVTLLIILVFVSFSYITYNSSKRDEQNKVWIGMAKETAHQLGTPTSSLLGWIEYLKTQDIDPQVVDEMSKDVDRLLTVVDRFSKIGSKTILEPINITEVAVNTVNYFQQRVPKKIMLSFYSLEEMPLIANANDVLFGWVIENLLRNAIDALGGVGEISVTTYCDKKWIYVDVSDNGKGIAPANIDKIFKPGFTTKSRGWGLGLSLSHRIIEQYHRGHIFVANS
ncbi:MAG: ATP-binding protein, partial [Rikenellaceae bacterium]